MEQTRLKKDYSYSLRQLQILELEIIQKHLILVLENKIPHIFNDIKSCGAWVLTPVTVI